GPGSPPAPRDHRNVPEQPETDGRPTARPRLRADNAGLGIGLTLVAIIIFGLQDALAKTLVQEYSPFQLAMMRFWAFAAFSLLLVMRQAPLRQALRSRVPALQVLRASLLVIDI